MICLRILVFCLVGSSFIVGMQQGDPNNVNTPDATGGPVVQASPSTLPKTAREVFYYANDVLNGCKRAFENNHFGMRTFNNCKAALKKNKNNESMIEDIESGLQGFKSGSSVFSKKILELADDDPQLIMDYKFLQATDKCYRDFLYQASCENIQKLMNCMKHIRNLGILGLTISDDELTSRANQLRALYPDAARMDDSRAKTLPNSSPRQSVAAASSLPSSPLQSSVPVRNAGEVSDFVKQVFQKYQTVLEENKAVVENAEGKLRQLQSLSPILVEEVAKLATDDQELGMIYFTCELIKKGLEEQPAVDFGLIKQLTTTLSKTQVFRAALNRVIPQATQSPKQNVAAASSLPSLPLQPSMPAFKAGEVSTFVRQVFEKYQTVLEENKAVVENAERRLEQLEGFSPILVEEVAKLDDSDPELATMHDICKDINGKLDRPTGENFNEVKQLTTTLATTRVFKGALDRFLASFPVIVPAQSWPQQSKPQQQQKRQQKQSRPQQSRPQRFQSQQPQQQAQLQEIFPITNGILDSFTVQDLVFVANLGNMEKLKAFTENFKDHIDAKYSDNATALVWSAYGFIDGKDAAEEAFIHLLKSGASYQVKVTNIIQKNAVHTFEEWLMSKPVESEAKQARRTRLQDILKAFKADPNADIPVSGVTQKAVASSWFTWKRGLIGAGVVAGLGLLWKLSKKSQPQQQAHDSNSQTA